MRALKDFSLAITHHPNVADCYKRRGQVLCALGGHVNNEDAVTDMTCAIKLDREQSGEDLSKRDPDALQQRGQVYQRQKNYKRALRDFREALEIRHFTKSSGAPSNNEDAPDKALATLWNATGLALNALGENEAAAQAYRAAIDANGPGGMKEAWCNLGQSYRDLGDERRSEQAFGEALRCDPNLVSALHMRGLLRHGTGRPCAALDDFSRGLFLIPNMRGADSWRASSFRAWASSLRR